MEVMLASSTHDRLKLDAGRIAKRCTARVCCQEQAGDRRDDG